MTWVMDAHTHIDKSFRIEDTDSGFITEVDYDDVDHDAVDAIASRVIVTLNQHLPHPEA